MTRNHDDILGQVADPHAVVTHPPPSCPPFEDAAPHRTICAHYRVTGGGTVSTRIETVRLVIRTFQARDVGPWLAMVTDPEVTRFLPPAPRSDRTMELAQRVIGERQAMERELGHAMWAVDDKMTGTLVGQCGLRPVDEGAGPEIDLAYHYTRASWNKGYGTEAAIAVQLLGAISAGITGLLRHWGVLIIGMAITAAIC